MDLSCKVATLPSYTFQDTTIENVTIPKNFTTIDKYVFLRTSVKNIICDNVSTIKSLAFDYVTGVESITFSSSLSLIQTQAFFECDINTVNLAQVDSCTLAEICFWNTTLNGEFYLPNNYVLSNDYINNQNGSNGQFLGSNISSFRVDADNPKYMTIDGVLYSRKSTDPTSSDFNVPIHLEAFPNARTEYTIPYTVTSIRRYELQGENLVNINVANGPNGEPHPTFSSEDGILYDDTGKCLLVLPAGRNDVTYTVKEGVTNLGGMDGSTSGYGGVGACKNLQYLYLPTSLKLISGTAMQYNENLKAVTVVGGTAQDGIFDFSGLPNLTHIAYKALEYCEKMTTLKLGTKIVHLGDGFALYATALTTIYCNATTAPSIETGQYTSNVIANNFKNMTIANVYVPSASLASYQAAAGWKNLPLKGQ